MTQSCYFCNKSQGVEFRKLFDLRSKHSGRLITEFIDEFQTELKLQRNIHDELNWICAECVSRIYAYDWTCMRLKEQEKELKNLLRLTETKVQQGLTGVNDLQLKVIDIRSEDETKPMISNPKPIIIQPSLSTNQNAPNHNASSAPPNPSTQNAKRSKPIIVRVVKRVPFLKSKPTTPVEQAKQATPVKTVTAATVGNRPLKRQTHSVAPNKRVRIRSKKPPETQSEAIGDGIPIKCEYCETVFGNIIDLQVS